MFPLKNRAIPKVSGTRRSLPSYLPTANISYGVSRISFISQGMYITHSAGMNFIAEFVSQILPGGDSLMIILSVIIAAFAVSYGWGVRGFVIGGEKGALLPGALLGFFIAFFTLGDIGPEYYLFYTAAGALSMFYGGTETYAQTMSFLLSRDVEGPYYNQLKKGVIGIFLKGALWFSIPGFILSMLSGALTGKYSMWEIIIMFALFPIVSVIGTKIFNTPYNKEKKIFPKLYFSLDRREEWGSNVMIILLLSVFTLKNGDFYSLGAGAFGFITGGLGFLLGLILFDIERRPLGKKFFGRLSEKGYIDGWKIMEHAFGAFSGGAIMLYFALNSSHYAEEIQTSDLKALPLGENSFVFAVIPMLLLVFTALQYPLIKYLEVKNKKVNTNIFEIIERPLWSAVPLIFIFLGSSYAAAFGAFMTLAYALCEKCALEWYEHSAYKKPTRAIFYVLWIVLTGWFYFNCDSILPLDIMLLYNLGYTGACMLYSFSPDNIIRYKKDKLPFNKAFGTGVTVTGHLIVQSIILIIITITIS